MSELPRFYCPNLSVGRVVLEEHESRHALRSLRLRPGDAATLFDGRGRAACAHLLPMNGRVRTRLAAFEVARVTEEPAPRRRLTLLVAAAKGPRLGWMVEKLTELEVSAIEIVNFERSVVRAEPRHAEKLQRTAIEAAKQSRRLWLPIIRSGEGFEAALQTCSAKRLLLAHLAADAVALSAALGSGDGECDDVAAIVGPEGDFTEREVALVCAKGGTPVRLARTVLRVETAAVAIAANWAARSV